MRRSDRLTGVVMKAFGESLPPTQFTNEDVARWHGRRDADWIHEKIGNRFRNTLFDFRSNQLCTDLDEDDLAYEASQRALKTGALSIEDIEAILFATISPTHNVFPDSACTLHRRLDAPPNTAAITLTTGCAGTLNAMMLASSMVQCGQARNVLVCSTSAMSAYIRPDLKDAMWLYGSIFGDGASAIVVGSDTSADGSHKETRGFSSFFTGANPDQDVAEMRFGGTKRPLHSGNTVEALADFVNFNFRAVPENLKAGFTYLYGRAVPRDEKEHEHPDWVLFNMSNARVQEEWLREQRIGADRSYFNQERVGNCGAASLGLVLGEFVEERKPAPGQLALLLSVGTGLQYAGVFYRF